jgi:hypothetical protein
MHDHLGTSCYSVAEMHLASSDLSERGEEVIFVVQGSSDPRKRLGIALDLMVKHPHILRHVMLNAPVRMIVWHTTASSWLSSSSYTFVHHN